MTAPIGFVGLGNVGLPASVNLLRAGHEVIGYSRSACAAFVSEGGRQAATLAELAGCPVIVQALPTAEALVTTIDELLPHIGPGTIIADLSSYPLAIKRQQAERVAATGAVMLDGEISGLPFQVAARAAVLFLAGDQAAVDGAAHVLDAIAEKRFYLGAFGAATRMKLIANFMVCAHNLIGAEALTLARASALDLDQVIEVIKPSAAGSTTFANKAPIMVARSFDNGRGPFSHMFGYLDPRGRARRRSRRGRRDAAARANARDLRHRPRSGPSPTGHRGDHRDRRATGPNTAMTPEEQDAEIARLKALMAKQIYYVMFREVRDASRLRDVLLDHYHWIIGLEKQGKVFASGPLTRQEGGGPGVGMTIFRADGFAEAEALAAGDPFVTSGAVGFRIDRWQVNEGRVTLSFDLSDQSGRIA